MKFSPCSDEGCPSSTSFSFAPLISTTPCLSLTPLSLDWTVYRPELVSLSCARQRQPPALTTPRGAPTRA
eukprot:3014037-Rhodomonas_salina.1